MLLKIYCQSFYETNFRQLQFMYTIIISLSRKRYTSQKSWRDTLDSLRLDKKSKTNKGYAPVVSNHKNGIFLLSQGIFTDHFPYTIASSQFSALQGSFSPAF